ncbi:hypothetical protein [Kitasatospora cheerisanensis]|uniref:Uncharacterized protein n=1 Tax=Kitasatospora cheerisanensis KCTC 2395 TaxID=1348663 RepID=A0A066Z4E6_9ACTN|nr:hypothetical protein [Kitasatospora cheerisanensis]KDN87119.1 hypothetical protein KCH_12040 [Kitasatospora cheerisanensis KCTC 2395]
MTGAVLVVVLLLVTGGCVCVVWADRGGPGWVRAVSRVTLGLGEFVRRDARRRRREDRRRIHDAGLGDGG